MEKQNKSDIEETVTLANGSTAPASTPKEKPGASWKANEKHVLPENKIVIVFCGLMLCVFLAALGEPHSFFLPLRVLIGP